MIPNFAKKKPRNSLQNHLSPSSKCQSGTHMGPELRNHCTYRCHSTQTSADTMMTTKMNACPSKSIKLLMISIMFFLLRCNVDKKGKMAEEMDSRALGISKWCYQIEPYSFHWKCCTYRKLLNRSMPPFLLLPITEALITVYFQCLSAQCI